MSTIALDSETTGLDILHGCRPFFVTMAYLHPDTNKLTNRSWRWDVNPRTREVLVNQQDISAIRAELDNADTIVMQNGKFDIGALASVGIDWAPYHDKTQDTLIASHILSSNTPHNLTALSVDYLNINIKKYEVALEEAVKKCRNRCRFYYKDWAVAKEGMPTIPSAKGTKSTTEDKEGGLWRNDLWLPHAMAVEQKYDADHEYYHVLGTYANVDSSATYMLWAGNSRGWHGMEAELKEGNLWKIYLIKRQLIRILSAMEKKGTTICSERVEQLVDEYREVVATLGERCVSIARQFNYDLSMPKGASPNASLRNFMLDVLKLPAQYNEKGKSDAPTLNKDAMAYYLATLSAGSIELDFVESLLEKRKKDTQLSYLADYQRFWIPVRTSLSSLNGSLQYWYTVHTHYNPTGTTTTRLSSSSPNVQNIATQEDEEGRSLRYCFGPMPGREWWSLDASNIELRIPAYEAGEPGMIEVFEHPDDPPYYGSYHLLIAHLIYPREFEQCLDGDGNLDGRLFKKRYFQLYKRVKNGDLADQYGAINRSDRIGTADRAFGVMGGQSRIENKFPRKTAHNRRCIAYAKKHRYVETIPSKLHGAGRGYPLLCTRSDYGKLLETVPLNYRTQGTAGEWMYAAMIRTDEFLTRYNREEGCDWFITLTVHDELVFDAPYMPNAGNLPVVKELQRLMELGGDDIGIPIPVSISYHPDNWGDTEAYLETSHAGAI